MCSEGFKLPPLQTHPQIHLGDIQPTRDAFAKLASQLRIPQNIGVLRFQGRQEFVEAHTGNEIEIVFSVAIEVRRFKVVVFFLGLTFFTLGPVIVEKVLLVDDNWGSIGTANFGYRSLFINYELTLISRNRHSY